MKIRITPARITSWTQGTGSLHTNYMFVTVPMQTGPGQSGLVILGTPADPYGLVSRLQLTLAAGSLATLVIALVGGYWLADRAMRPVHTITQAARTIGETDLSRRLNMKSKDELGELANTFDGMLGRLQAAFERQRQFVADASHELRTPLTIVNLETSRTLASPHKPEEYRHALATIRSENDFMTALVNDLLTLARMDAGQAAMESLPVDLSDVALDTIERLSPLAARNGVRLEAGDLPEARILGDRQRLVQMVSNLVDNAIKYAAGEDKKVSIETGTDRQIPPGCVSRITVRALPRNTCPTCSTVFTGSTRLARVGRMMQLAQSLPLAAGWDFRSSSGSSNHMVGKSRWRARSVLAPPSWLPSRRFEPLALLPSQFYFIVVTYEGLI